MFKLRLIKKPILFKLKCDFSFPPIVLANLQEKEVTPTKERQEIVADSQYDGLSKVIVKGYVPKVANKTITSNGIYSAKEEGLDGYDIVNVETSGVDINDYYDLTKKSAGGARTYIKKFPMIDTSTYKSMTDMFAYFSNLEEIPLLDTSNVTDMLRTFAYCRKLKSIPLLDTNNVTNMSQIFQYCDSLERIPQLNTNKVKQMSNMFDGCQKLTSVPLLNASKVTSLGSMFNNCKELKDLEGLVNLGESYSTTASARYGSYTLRINNTPKLTEQSIINILNNLYDIKQKGCNVQQINLGNFNLAKLTSEEGQQALIDAKNKGWEVI